MDQTPRKIREAKREARKAAGYKNPYGQAKIKLPESDNMSRFTLVATGTTLLASIYVLVRFYSIDLPLLGLIKFICFFIGFSFLIPIKWYRKKLTMSYYEYAIFNVISIAPFLTASLLFLNGALAGETYRETHAIESAYNESGQIYFNFEDAAYQDKAYLRTIGKFDEVEVTGSDSLSIYFSDGAFGFRNIKGKSLH